MTLPPPLPKDGGGEGGVRMTLAWPSGQLEADAELVRHRHLRVHLVVRRSLEPELKLLSELLQSAGRLDIDHTRRHVVAEVLLTGAVHEERFPEHPVIVFTPVWTIHCGGSWVLSGLDLRSHPKSLEATSCVSRRRHGPPDPHHGRTNELGPVERLEVREKIRPAYAVRPQRNLPHSSTSPDPLPPDYWACST